MKKLAALSRSMRISLLAMLSAVFVQLAATTATAEEVILKFVSDVTVNKDGSLTVTETIRVRAERRRIRRGIFRDFPVLYREQGGFRRKVGFKVLEVKRDGRDEPNFTKNSGDHKRLYIGSKYVFLPRGEYEYTIKYKTTRQLRYFENYDELYWNATGTKWAFPIIEAVARVRLPDGAKMLRQAGYTGNYGATNRDYTFSKEGDGALVFETTNELPARNGLTIAVAWQKGVVAQPGRLTNLLYFLLDNIGLIVLLLGTIGSAVYFVTTWNRVGRDPDEGVIIPLFSPPKGLSPAAVSYIHYRQLKSAGSNVSVGFIAALVSLASKGVLKIDNSSKDLKIERGDPTGKHLPTGERTLFNKLLGSRKSLTFKESTHKTVSAARQAFRAAIHQEHGEVYFKDNVGLALLGSLIAVITLVIFGFFTVLGRDEELFSSLAVLASSGVGTLLLFMGINRLWDNVPGGGSKVIGVLLVILGAVVLIPAILITLWASFLPKWAFICIAALAAMNVVFFDLLHAPTEFGRDVMDKIEGFKLYLSVAEADRLNMAGAPEVSPEVFERFLPYAIALGVEKPWSDALQAQLAKYKAAGRAVDYQPHWYYGGSRGWDSSAISAATAGIVTGVSAGMAAATPPSSSGSGGGGFSGGGGGGGGGGGW